MFLLPPEIIKKQYFLTKGTGTRKTETLLCNNTFHEWKHLKLLKKSIPRKQNIIMQTCS